MKRSFLAFPALVSILAAVPTLHAQTAMEHHDSRPKVKSTTVTVTAGGKSTTLTMADLQAMPQRTLRVHNGHNNQDETYTGIGMSDLLAKFGLTLDNGGAQKVYHSYVRATGTDKYWVLYSATELEPAIATWDSILAIAMDGKPIEADGAFKIVAGGERRPARWVTNLTALNIVTVE